MRRAGAFYRLSIVRKEFQTIVDFLLQDIEYFFNDIVLSGKDQIVYIKTLETRYGCL